MQGMGEFLNEMAVLMSQNDSNVSLSDVFPCRADVRTRFAIICRDDRHSVQAFGPNAVLIRGLVLHSALSYDRMY